MSDAAAWDARYASGGFAFGEAPNRHLEAQAWRLRPGQRALAIGDGEGRNGVWLAGRGLAVTAVDRRGQVYRRANRGDHIDLAAPGVNLWTAASISGVRTG